MRMSKRWTILILAWTFLLIVPSKNLYVFYLMISFWFPLHYSSGAEERLFINKLHMLQIISKCVCPLKCYCLHFFFPLNHRLLVHLSASVFSVLSSGSFVIDLRNRLETRALMTSAPDSKHSHVTFIFHNLRRQNSSLCGGTFVLHANS